MNLWDDITRYKKCKKKQYDIHVCIPPKNTVVFNKLEQADSIKLLGGKTFFTVEEVNKLKKTGNPKFDTIQQLLQAGKGYLVNENTPCVLCGTVGELWTIGLDKLMAKYSFVIGGQVTPINQQTIQQRMKEGTLNWMIVRTKPDTSGAYACHIPNKHKGQIATSWGAVLNINGEGVRHGKGDFVIAGVLPDGSPNMQDRYVVNGDIFATTYDNRGWQDCLGSVTAKPNSSVTPPELFKPPIVKEAWDCLDATYFHNFLNIYRGLTSKFTYVTDSGNSTEKAYEILSSIMTSEEYKQVSSIVSAFMKGYKSNIDSLDILSYFFSEYLGAHQTLAFYKLLYKDKKTFKDWFELQGVLTALYGNKNTFQHGLREVYPSNICRGDKSVTATSMSIEGYRSNNPKLKYAAWFISYILDTKGNLRLSYMGSSEISVIAKDDFENALMKEIKSLIADSSSLFAEMYVDKFRKEVAFMLDLAGFTIERTDADNIRIQNNKEDFSVGLLNTVVKIKAESVNGKPRFTMTGKDGGFVLNKSYSLDRNMANFVTYFRGLAIQAYIDICKSLKITPFDFITTHSFINFVLDQENGGGVHSYRFTHADFLVENNYDYLFKVKDGGFQTSRGEGQAMRQCKFTLRYFNRQTRKPISEYPVIISTRFRQADSVADMVYVSIKILGHTEKIESFGSLTELANVVAECLYVGRHFELERQRKSNATQKAKKDSQN